jgi:hypothetical protein
MPNLPMYQEQLENFIYHHIHEWAKEYVEQNKDDFPDLTLHEEMDREYQTFMWDLDQRFREEIIPKFGDV